MNSLEQLVRPSISTVRLTTRRITAKQTPQNRQPVAVAWGTAGALPQPTKEDDGQLSFKIENCNDTFTEKSRKTSQQTITDSESGASVSFDITDKIIFSKAPSDADNVGSFRTETTSYSVADPFAGTSFGDVPKGQICDSSYTLNN